MPLEATVYILRCSDGSYYTGLTKQPVEARLWEHNEGLYDGYTRKRRPVVLVFTETYDRMLDAIARERQIKGWTRAKKEALIARTSADSHPPRLTDATIRRPLHPHGEPVEPWRQRTSLPASDEDTQPCST